MVSTNVSDQAVRDQQRTPVQVCMCICNSIYACTHCVSIHNMF